MLYVLPCSNTAISSFHTTVVEWSGGPRVDQPGCGEESSWHRLLQFYCSLPCSPAVTSHCNSIWRGPIYNYLSPVGPQSDLITIMVQLSVITVVVDVAGGGEREEGAHSDKTRTKPVLTIRSAAGLQADNSSPSVLSQFRGYNLPGM